MTPSTTFLADIFYPERIHAVRTGNWRAYWAGQPKAPMKK